MLRRVGFRGSQRAWMGTTAHRARWWTSVVPPGPKVEVSSSLPHPPSQKQSPVQEEVALAGPNASGVTTAHASAPSAELVVPKPPLMRRVVTAVVEGAKHYWLGSKLLYLNVRAAMGLLRKVADGHELTRRERRNLMRTTSDLFRLVPFVVIAVVPFLEFALPLILKLFPNMLPSTFEDKLQKEEKLKKQLQLKIEVARFMQETVTSMRDRIEDADMSKKFDGFMERVISGQDVTAAELEEYSRLFEDEFTIDNLSRQQLTSVCRFLNLRHYGTDAFLRWQIMNRLKQLKEDDVMIVAEGVKNLTFEELQQACVARGMRGHGISKEVLRNQLNDWLEMSLTKRVPGIILVLSRIMMITANLVPDQALRETLSNMPEEVLDEVELVTGEISGKTDVELKLEVLRHELDEIEDEDKLAKMTAKEIEQLEMGIERDFANAGANLRAVADAISEFSSHSAVRKERAQYDSLKDQWANYKKRKAELRVLEKPSSSSSSSTSTSTSTSTSSSSSTPSTSNSSSSSTTVSSGTMTSASSSSSSNPVTSSESSQGGTGSTKSTSSSGVPTSSSTPTMTSSSSNSSTVSSSTGPKLETSTTTVKEENLKKSVSSEKKREGESMAELVSEALEEAHRARMAAASTDSGVVSAPPPPSPAAAVASEDSSTARTRQRLERRIDAMLAALEGELAMVDRKVGDKLNLIDRDHDGVVTATELEDALSHLRAKPTADDIRVALQILDPDRDGKVLVSDIELVKAKLLELEKEKSKTSTSSASSKK